METATPDTENSGPGAPCLWDSGWLRAIILDSSGLTSMFADGGLLSHRSSGLPSAQALIELVYLCCGGLRTEHFHG